MSFSRPPPPQSLRGELYIEIDNDYVKKRKVPQKVIQKIYALVMTNEVAVTEHRHIRIP